MAEYIGPRGTGHRRREGEGQMCGSVNEKDGDNGGVSGARAGERGRGEIGA
jgi:hypothetical protein